MSKYIPHIFPLNESQTHKKCIYVCFGFTLRSILKAKIELVLSEVFYRMFVRFLNTLDWI